jgi:F1F0 ATPase subunit 2
MNNAFTMNNVFTMNNILTMILMVVAGGGLGAVFFGGLWWTVRKGLGSKRPALWFFGSMLLRMSITLVGFYFVTGANWKRLFFCLLGFIIARFIVIRLTRATEKPTHICKEGCHES